MMNGEPNGPDMVLQLLGKGECFSNELAAPLPHGPIEPLYNYIGEAGVGK